MTPYFFGYGSLVNTTTHDYPDAQPATLSGWRRAWVRTAERDVVFLSVLRDPTCQIDGLIAAVPNADWAALDKRESGYARLPSEGQVQHNLQTSPQIAHYAVPLSAQRTGGDHMILLSYLDVVVQGFLAQFGTSGVDRFFATTQGWDTPVLNDRDAPRYPRARQLSAPQTALVDSHLAALSARVEKRH